MPQKRMPFSRQAELGIDELSDVASGTSLKIDCLTASEGLSRIRQIGHPGRWGFDDLKLSAHVRADGSMEDGMAAFLFIERSQGSTIAGMPLSDDTVLTLPPGGEIRASMRIGTVYRGIVVPIDAWNALQEQTIGFSAPESKAPSLLQLDAAQGATLRRETLHLGDRLDAELARGTALGDGQGGLPRPLAECLAVLADTQAQARDGYAAINRSHDARLRQAWRANDFILAHLSDDLSVSKLCAVVNASRRQLEYAFRTTFDCSPHDFVQSARLNEIRRQLQLGDGRTITEIALDNGIQHLGRFSAAYRRLFGESPKDTALRRVAAHARHARSPGHRR